MFILKSIGAFFVKIWRWIKETAWVQPLLIVGAIFAIIFSIPSITNAVSSWTKTTSGSWLLEYRISLEGEAYNEDASNADKLTKTIYEANRYVNGQEDDEKLLESVRNQYGEKFYLVYVNGTSSDSDTLSDSFRYLSENWGSTSLKLDRHDGEGKNLPFKFNVIYTDETSSNDKDYEAKNSPSAFDRYLSNHADLFNTAGEYLENQPYRINASIDETKYDNFSLNNTSSTTTALSSDFPKPSILLCDFTDKAISMGKAGVAEIAFSISGDTDNTRAEFLMNMWNHTDNYVDYPDNNFLQRI